MTQIVRTIFRADTSQYSRAMKSARDSTDSAVAGIEKMHKRIDGLRNLLAGGALSFGIGKMIGGLVSINRQAESTRIGMATLIQSTERFVGNNMRFGTALERSASLMGKLRQEAVDTPGTLKQVSDAFGTIYMKSRQAGLSEDQIVKFAGNIATQDSMSGGTGTVQRDVNQLLKGDIGDIGTPQLAAIKEQVQKLVKKGKLGQAATKVVNALDLDPEARKAAGATFDGQLSSAEDKLKAIAEIAGQPLFEQLNRSLGTMLAWMDKNKAKVEEMAKKVGGALVDAFNAVVNAVTTVGEMIQWIVDSPIASFLGAIPLIYAAFTTLAAHPFFAAIAALGSVIMFAKAAGAAGSAVIDPSGTREKLLGITPESKLAQFKDAGNIRTLQAAERAGYDVGGHVDMSDSDLAAQSSRADAIMRAHGLGRSATGNYASALDELARTGKGDEFSTVARVVFERARREHESATYSTWGQDAETGIRQEREFGYLHSGRSGDLGWTDQMRQNQSMNAWQLSQPAFALPEKAFSKVDIKVDAKGSKIIQTVKVTTNDPARLTRAGLAAAFTNVVARPLSGRMGLGSVGLATGR